MSDTQKLRIKVDQSDYDEWTCDLIGEDDVFIGYPQESREDAEGQKIILQPMLDAHAAQARKEGLLEAARLVCSYCKHNISLTTSSHHYAGTSFYGCCRAKAIHARIAELEKETIEGSRERR